MSNLSFFIFIFRVFDIICFSNFRDISIKNIENVFDVFENRVIGRFGKQAFKNRMSKYIFVLVLFYFYRKQDVNMISNIT